MNLLVIFIAKIFTYNTLIYHFKIIYNDKDTIVFSVWHNHRFSNKEIDLQ